MTTFPETLIAWDEAGVYEPDLHESQERVATAELADCTCPEFCERDHDTD